MTSNNDGDIFNSVMFEVGDSGKFQKWYNINFNLIFTIFSSMATFNIIICLATPEHWCYVPGKKFTNFTTDEWKSLNIPRQNNFSLEFNKCTLYNTSTNDIMKCQNGWDFDKTYYKETIVSQESWVCENSLQATNLLVYAKTGELMGTILVQLGDIYGRKPVVYSSIIAVIIGRLGLVISSGTYILYVIFMIIGSLAAVPLQQATLVVAVEISSVEDRTSLPLVQCIGYSIGLCLAPIIFWLVGSWVPFVIITTVPMIFFIFLRNYFIESPRWLASKGHLSRCIKELKKISKINKTAVSDKLLNTLNEENVKTEENNSFGIIALFSNWNLAKNTILLMLGWISYLIIYLILYLNISNLKGNPFWNYFWQGLAELPGYFMGRYLSGKIGRKYTRFGSFIIIAVIAVILAYFLAVNADARLISICGILLKFFISTIFFTANLQTIEIYPTCLRQTGTSIVLMVGTCFAIFSPYMTYLGTTLHPSIPYGIVTFLALVGGFSGMFLPETLNERLPDTLKEAEDFGRFQRVWSLPQK